MPIGAHVSIAGGIDQALRRGACLRCETIQLFTKNRNRWETRALSRADLNAFRRARRKATLGPLLAHSSYLINLASSDSLIWEKSVRALREELARAALLKIPFLVLHPGSHGGSGEEVGLRRVAEALHRVLEGAERSWPVLLLETTAGQGSGLGCRFEHLAQVRDRSDHRRRIGFCFDTCHVFAAGYDLRSSRSYRETMDRFLDLVGLENLKAFHLNDSRKGLGSRVDRHHHIGEGALGILPFRLLLRDERFRRLPMILETPKGRDGGRDLDEINLELLRKLRGDKCPERRLTEGSHEKPL